MSFHIIHIDNAAYISCDNKRLAIKKPDNDTNYIAACDIAALILNHPQITITHQAIALCTQHDTIILITDGYHLPSALCYPMTNHYNTAKRPHQQARYIDSNHSKKWWQKIIQAKIAGQATLLEHIKSPLAKRLWYITHEVTIGDKKLHEAQAAKIYWQEFFTMLQGGGKRHKQGADDSINQHLNYGYAIVRAMIARSCSAAGLCLNFGIGHYRKDNPFNLVEDLVEPYRYFVDNIIFHHAHDHYYHHITTQSKTHLLQQITALEIDIADKTWRILPSIDDMVKSYGQMLDNPLLNLRCPFGDIDYGK